MSTILVTGGTGTLGRVIVDQLTKTSHSVRVLSRQPAPASSTSPEWSVGDLRTNAGLDAAVTGVGTIIHCASKRDDVASAMNLIEAARKEGCSHLVFISIVGVDQIPIGYYRSKLEVERRIEASGIPFTILRTTQFHDLIVRVMASLSRMPIMPIPSRTSFQPIDVREVAARLVDLSLASPAQRVSDMGGPQILGTADLAHAFLQAIGRHRLVMPVRVPGKGFAGFRRGANLSPDRSVGQFTFDQYLGLNYPKG